METVDVTLLFSHSLCMASGFILCMITYKLIKIIFKEIKEPSSVLNSNRQGKEMFNNLNK